MGQKVWGEMFLVPQFLSVFYLAFAAQCFVLSLPLDGISSFQ